MKPTKLSQEQRQYISKRANEAIAKAVDKAIPPSTNPYNNSLRITERYYGDSPSKTEVEAVNALPKDVRRCYDTLKVFMEREAEKEEVRNKAREMFAAKLFVERDKLNEAMMFSGAEGALSALSNFIDTINRIKP